MGLPGPTHRVNRLGHIVTPEGVDISKSIGILLMNSYYFTQNGGSLRASDLSPRISRVTDFGWQGAPQIKVSPLDLDMIWI